MVFVFGSVYVVNYIYRLAYACEMGFLDTAHRWVLAFYPIFQSVSFDWSICPFTFRIIIVMCEFDPAILMLAGCFAC